MSLAKRAEQRRLSRLYTNALAAGHAEQDRLTRAPTFWRRAQLAQQAAQHHLIYCCAMRRRYLKLYFSDVTGETYGPLHFASDERVNVITEWLVNHTFKSRTPTTHCSYELPG